MIIPYKVFIYSLPYIVAKRFKKPYTITKRVSKCTDMITIPMSRVVWWSRTSIDKYKRYRYCHDLSGHLFICDFHAPKKFICATVLAIKVINYTDCIAWSVYITSLPSPSLAIRWTITRSCRLSFVPDNTPGYAHGFILYYLIRYKQVFVSY